MTGSIRFVADTPISPYCNESTGNCIYQRRWAYHVTLGEAF